MEQGEGAGNTAPSPFIRFTLPVPARRYQLILHASGFVIPEEGEEPSNGFLTVRRVMADDEDEAARIAIEELLAEPRVAAMMEQTAEATGTSASCKVEVEKCDRIGWLRWTFASLPQGFMYYRDGAKADG